MQHLKIFPIVEGHGEVDAVQKLLRRICSELLKEVVPHILPPFRQPKDRLLANKDACLENAVNFAVMKLRERHVPDATDLILVLVDADDLCAAKVGPSTFDLAHASRSDADIAVVLAVPEFETWFVAAAGSLTDFLTVDDVALLPTDPESERCGKRWIERHFKGPKYSETVDQPKLTAKMDLTTCRERIRDTTMANDPATLPLANTPRGIGAPGDIGSRLSSLIDKHGSPKGSRSERLSVARVEKFE